VKKEKKSTAPRSMQDKILDTLREKVEAAGLEFVQNSDYSNTGKVYVQSAKGFTTFFAFAYDFQPGNCSMQVYPPGKEVVGGMIGKDRGAIGDFYVRYEQVGGVDKMIAWFDHAIARRGNVEKKGGMLEIAS
jgi:hypothetical protein